MFKIHIESNQNELIKKSKLITICKYSEVKYCWDENFKWKNAFLILIPLRFFIFFLFLSFFHICVLMMKKIFNLTRVFMFSADILTCGKKKKFINIKSDFLLISQLIYMDYGWNYFNCCIYKNWKFICHIHILIMQIALLT